MTRITWRRRVTDYLDRITVEADDQARAHGLTVTAHSRYRRTYRDPRFAALAAARTAGCDHVPVCAVGPGSDLPACVGVVARSPRRAA